MQEKKLLDIREDTGGGVEERDCKHTHTVKHTHPISCMYWMAHGEKPRAAKEMRSLSETILLASISEFKMVYLAAKSYRLMVSKQISD